jgi:phage repressor protein C with HTH and peptisase S24 domain
MPQSFVAREIERRMKALGKNPKQIARDANLNENYVYNILTGKTANPTVANLRKVAKELDCTVQDLTDPPLIREIKDTVNELQVFPEDTSPLPGGPEMPSFLKHRGPANVNLSAPALTIGIDELDVRAGAGAAALHETEQVRAVWQIPRDLLRSYSSTPAEYIKIATIVGDSMEPTLMAATKVMIDTQDKRPSPPGIFYVWDGIGLVCKRVEIVPGSDPLRVRLISDNERYKPYEINLDDAQIQGRVMGRWQWV